MSQATRDNACGAVGRGARRCARFGSSEHCFGWQRYDRRWRLRFVVVVSGADDVITCRALHRSRSTCSCQCGSLRCQCAVSNRCVIVTIVVASSSSCRVFSRSARAHVDAARTARRRRAFAARFVALVVDRRRLTTTTTIALAALAGEVARVVCIELSRTSRGASLATRNRRRSCLLRWLVEMIIEGATPATSMSPETSLASEDSNQHPVAELDTALQVRSGRSVVGLTLTRSSRRRWASWCVSWRPTRRRAPPCLRTLCSASAALCARSSTVVVRAALRRRSATRVAWCSRRCCSELQVKDAVTVNGVLNKGGFAVHGERRSMAAHCQPSDDSRTLTSTSDNG